MSEDATTLDDLRPLVGEWALAADFAPAEDIGARTTFEWMPGNRFLVQRWEVPVDEAPDGIAVIGPDPEADGGFLQHYFDTRGVARVYRMGFDGRTWTLSREEPDFSPLSFAQRFTGTLSDDGDTISGAWEIRHPGQDWERDFGLTYTRVR